LVERAESLARRFRIEEQIEVVNAHPRIGANAADVAAQSSLSYREQGYDREAGLPTSEVERTYAELAQLNRAYEDRFGFRFVVFVNKRPKAQIVDVLRTRLLNSPDIELETALGDLFSIARDRCQQLVRSSMQPMRGENAAREAVLEGLRRSALETYGEERSVEAGLQTALASAATAVRRVSEEPLDPLGNDPLPTHD
jgi:2-oxo-4-hydroxy-4-carboxy--5-ureidoimidazoline (OHCU) decarboxylase